MLSFLFCSDYLTLASSDTVESEGRQMNQWLNKVHLKKSKKSRYLDYLTRSVGENGFEQRKAQITF
jgi:hypothetical protein